MQIFKSASTAMLTVGEVEEREGGREGVVVRRASHHDAAGRGQRADRSSGRGLVAGSGDTQWRRRSRRRRPNNIIAEKEESERGREKIIDLCDMD